MESTVAIAHGLVAQIEPLDEINRTAGEWFDPHFRRFMTKLQLVADRSASLRP